MEPFLAILSNEPTRFKVVTTLGFRWRIQWALSDLGQHAKSRAIRGAETALTEFEGGPVSD